MSRREDVFSRVARGVNRRTPDQECIRQAVQTITSHPDWPVVLDYLDMRERTATAVSDMADEHGALLRAAGRRSLLRELEGLDKRVIDDDRSEQHG
mgnify:CR=1 FL=1